MASQSLVPSLPLFTDEADLGLRVFKRLHIPDVQGTPTMGEACGDWFFPIVSTLFGSFDRQTNRRMISEFFLSIPKKNSKSSYGGPLMLTAAIVNRRPEAEFNFIAPTIQIANIAFKQAVNTIRIDPELDALFLIQRHIRTITNRVTGALLQIKAADTDVVTGGKPVGTMIDETHVFASKTKAADIFVELRGALAARPDGFLFQTTTQSKEPPAGVFKSELQTARDVRDGLIDLPLLPILYEYPEAILEKHAWKERKYWGLVNPNLGRSVDPAFLERELAKAEREGKEQMVLVASQHFNVEIGLRMRSDQWRGANYWEAATVAEIADLDVLLARSEVATIGIDGGGLDDLLGITVIGREFETQRYLLWSMAFAQRDVLDVRKEIAERLKDFEQAGDLVFCDVGTEDINLVADIVEQVFAAGLLPEEAAIGFDPQGVQAFVDELGSRGIGGKMVVSVPQGFRLSGAVWGMERKLKDGTLVHGGRPMMAWCVSNAKAEQRGNAVHITKQTAGKAKIDPLIAAFNAFQLMARNPVAMNGNSLYVSERVLVA